MSAGGALGLEPVAAGGFGLCEAPRVTPDGTVWFSDVTGGGVFRIAPGADAIDEVLPGRRGVGGLVAHARGGVVVSGRDLVHLHDDGTTTDVSTPGDDTGITGFNDLTVDVHGWLLAGALRFRPMAGEPPVPGRVLVVAPGWVAVAVDEGVDWPNGLGLSPDGRRCYLADYAHRRVLVVDVDRDGALAEAARTWVQAPEGLSADGLAVDAEGGVWVATGQGGSVVRLDPDSGAITESLEGLAPFVSSIAFGGEDGRDVLVTTAGGEGGGTVLRGRAPVAGTPIPATIV
ncbi:SMP-30/gluconolactonase/LRE family protein [Conexibacter sp. SYSU D00693]|uniref:SMP-30/gluconolactonase/LRE family protein n=1 Tax=Conexibacter sp. SYSU D00693 TaxID=2812560 RepID=UPI00196B3E1D|nr:SMP-30/gluconolactonase/LRE family protein [Conexibacter sp. SYSU D00693]